MAQPVEKVGDFRLHPPDVPDGRGIWSIAYGRIWLPLLCTDHAACEAVMEALDAKDDWEEIVAELNQLQGRSGMFKPLTAKDIAQYMESRS